ncbi:MAG TPA: TonB family protein [Puia sp.]|jgi:protein TonB|nr:TonB family protein [Puia sp.]
MRIIPLFFLLSAALTVRSQRQEEFYLLNADWHGTSNKDSARYFLREKQISDTCWQFDYYNLVGPLLRSEQFRDQDGGVQHGISYYYDRTGRLDSSTQFRNGKKNGDSFKFTGDSMVMRFKYVYRDDSLVEFVDVKKQKHDNDPHDSVEKESEYPGGVNKWIRYLNKNLKYPDRALNSNIEGEVRVLFIVDKDGSVLLPVICHSVEFSLDEESLRIVRESGKWTPGFQFGRLVKTYKIQPIVFKLSAG